MRVNRRRGDRLLIETHKVGPLREQKFTFLEDDIQVAWKRVPRTDDPRLVDPYIKTLEEGWELISSLTGESLATVKLVPPRRGRPKT